MGKVIDCNKVNPSSDCHHIVRGQTEEEVLEKAKIHAKEHGFSETTPELVQMIKANIRDE